MHKHTQRSGLKVPPFLQPNFGHVVVVRIVVNIEGVLVIGTVEAGSSTQEPHNVGHRKNIRGSEH